MKPTCDIRIFGGLPVTVEYSVQGPEPDVGIMSSWVEDWSITHIAGRKVKRPSQVAWLYTKLGEDKKATDALVDAIYQSWCDDTE